MNNAFKHSLFLFIFSLSVVSNLVAADEDNHSKGGKALSISNKTTGFELKFPDQFVPEGCQICSICGCSSIKEPIGPGGGTLRSFYANYGAPTTSFKVIAKSLATGKTKEVKVFTKPAKGEMLFSEDVDCKNGIGKCKHSVVYNVDWSDAIKGWSIEFIEKTFGEE